MENCENCKYCKENPKKISDGNRNLYDIEIIGNNLAVEIKDDRSDNAYNEHPIKYCPMCGKELVPISFKIKSTKNKKLNPLIWPF